MTLSCFAQSWVFKLVHISTRHDRMLSTGIGFPAKIAASCVHSMTFQKCTAYHSRLSALVKSRRLHFVLPWSLTSCLITFTVWVMVCMHGTRNNYSFVKDDCQTRTSRLAVIMRPLNHKWYPPWLSLKTFRPIYHLYTKILVKFNFIFWIEGFFNCPNLDL